MAGCRYFFGYPITPQDEIAEFMAQELPRLGGVYLQPEGEGSVGYMLLGAALCGVRAMTATSGPGFSLMQEAISHMAAVEAPAVIVEVMRLGPGAGAGGPQGQMDYHQVTKGGGHGAYRCIVLAPYSVQESFDFMQLAFHLADKYRILVIVVTDFILAKLAEPLELRALEFEPLPPKDWALRGKAWKGNRFDHHPTGFVTGDVQEYFRLQREKYQRIIQAEVRYQTYEVEDARIILVAYGSMARVAEGAVEQARALGLKVGLFRPITLWPFPGKALRETSRGAEKVLVIEDGPGEMVEDVEAAIQGRVPVHFLGLFARHHPGPLGLIYPERVLDEVKKLA